MLEKKSFYFARHGESEHNKKKLCAGGKIDSPLTKKGVQQARELKSKLQTVKINYVISSPMIRAKKTAEIAWNNHFFVEENIREFNLGIFEGTLDQGVTEYVIDLPYETPIPEGESKAIFITRITEAFNKWLYAQEGIPLFIAHGFVYGALLDIMGLPIVNSDGTPVDIDNTALIHFHHNGFGWIRDPS